jgi:hypothetical protein
MMALDDLGDTCRLLDKVGACNLLIGDFHQFFNNRSLKFPGYLPLLIILLWYMLAYRRSHSAAAALITLDHGTFRRCCSSRL